MEKGAIPNFGEFEYDSKTISLEDFSPSAMHRCIHSSSTSYIYLNSPWMNIWLLCALLSLWSLLLELLVWHRCFNSRSLSRATQSPPRDRNIVFLEVYERTEFFSKATAVNPPTPFSNLFSFSGPQHHRSAQHTSTPFNSHKCIPYLFYQGPTWHKRSAFLKVVHKFSTFNTSTTQNYKQPPIRRTSLPSQYITPRRSPPLSAICLVFFPWSKPNHHDMKFNPEIDTKCRPSGACQPLVCTTPFRQDICLSFPTTLLQSSCTVFWRKHYVVKLASSWAEQGSLDLIHTWRIVGFQIITMFWQKTEATNLDSIAMCYVEACARAVFYLGLETNKLPAICSHSCWWRNARSASAPWGDLVLV